MRNETGCINPTPCHRYLEVRRQALCDNLLHRDLSISTIPSITRPQLLRDHPGGLSKRRGHLNQLIGLPSTVYGNTHPRWYNCPFHPTPRLTPGPLAPTHMPVPVNHVLRVSGDCCDTGAGILKSWRTTQGHRDSTNSLQAPASTSPG